jgi:AcrR family transcriptional regulator
MSTRMTAEERRTEIVDAAARAIVAKGVGGFRVRDVADEAGVSQPLVSTHFRSRDELILAAFVQSDERAAATVRERVDAAPTGRERLLLQMRASIDAGDDPVAEQSWHLWQEVWSHGLVEESLRGAVLDRLRVWLQRIEDLIGQGQEDGTLRPGVDPADAALYLNMMVDGVGPSLRYAVIDLPKAFQLLEQAVDDLLGLPG